MIHTERLTLRHIRESDWTSIQQIWESMNASPWAQYDRPHNTDSADVRNRIAKWAEVSKGTDHRFFAVCLCECVIGYIAFNRRRDGYEIGYCFHLDYHGKGYARESLAALMEYMKSIGTAKLTAGTAIHNTPSVKLLSSLGFVRTKAEKVSFYKDECGNDIVFDGGVYEKIL